jgi:hypothetical protein
MAVTTEVIENSYTAGAGATEFVFTFPVHDQTWLKVYQDGVLLDLGDDYSVTGVGDSGGGTITLTVGAGAGDIILITLDVPITQGTVYNFNSKFPEAAHEAALDKLTLICLLLQHQIDLGGSGIASGTTVVGSGVHSVDIDFDFAADDDEYTVSVCPYFESNGWWITAKTETGFTINFSVSPNSASSVDWRAVYNA